MSAPALATLLLRPDAGDVLLDATPTERYELMRYVAMAALAVGHQVHIETDEPEEFVDLHGYMPAHPRADLPTILILDRPVSDLADFLADPDFRVVADWDATAGLHSGFSTSIISDAPVVLVSAPDGSYTQPMPVTRLPLNRVLDGFAVLN